MQDHLCLIAALTAISWACADPPAPFEITPEQIQTLKEDGVVHIKGVSHLDASSVIFATTTVHQPPYCCSIAAADVER